MNPPNMEQRLEALRLYTVYSDLFDLWNDGPSGNDDRLDYHAQMHTAYDAYMDYGAELYLDGDGEPVKCGLSGVPLLGDDELLEDVHSGELFLRSALGLPARAEEAEGDRMPQSDMVDGIAG